MITVPPCQQVSERESVRGGGGGGDDEEKKSGGGEMGLLSFLTHTWQMSSHRVGLRERKRSVSAVVVSQIENRFPFSVLSAEVFSRDLLSGH